MVRSRKAFDCVQMKRDAQAQIAKDAAHLPRATVKAAQQRAIQADPILGPFLARVTALSDDAEAMVASAKR